MAFRKAPQASPPETQFTVEVNEFLGRFKLHELVLSLSCDLNSLLIPFIVCLAFGDRGADVCAANSRRAPPHAVGRGSWRRHRARSAAAASDRRGHHFLVPWRAARARVAPWRTIQPPTTHALNAACLARLSARPTRNALHPTPLTEAPLRRHRDLSAAVASNRRCRLVLVPWRAARARSATWRTSRPPTEHLSLRAACLARLSARPTRDALHPTPLAEAPGADTAPG